MSYFFWKTALCLFAILEFTQAWHLVCYKGSLSNSLNVTSENATLLITNGYIDINKITLICAHGYMGTPLTQGINLLTAALLLLGFNVCALDYSKEANFGPIPFVNYPSSVAATYVVSKEMAHLIKNLVLLGFNVNTLHMMGHSLGAHVCGNIGKYYTEETGEKIGRISGLDAAKYGFDGSMPISMRISKEHAHFVDVIHTDTCGYGMETVVGHMDVFVCPNEYERDRRQPGCPIVNPLVDKPMSPNAGCSHQRSVRVTLDTITSTSGCTLLAAKTESVTAWNSPTFVADQVTCIGLYTNLTSRGIYYLRTNDQSPFGLGDAGTRPQ